LIVVLFDCASIISGFTLRHNSMSMQKILVSPAEMAGHLDDPAWVVIDGNGNHESFDQHVSEIVFAPQGSFHYFENRGPGEMKIVIIQNTSAAEDKDNIGIGECLSGLPPRVLSAVFGVPETTFKPFKKIDKAIVILKST